MTNTDTLDLSQRPAYRVLDPAGFYGPDDNLWPENAEIYFDGEPNEQMEPLNVAAHQRLTTYLNRLDDFAKIAAEKAGRPFVGRPRSLDGAIAIATQDMRNSMSIMGKKEEVTSIAPMNKGDVPETGSINAKRARGRPKLVKAPDAVPLSSPVHIAA